MKNKNTGFTLIELIVVILIIGILSTITIPIFKGYLLKARDTTRIRSVHDMGIVMVATRSADQNNPPFDAIIDGTTNTTPANIKTLLSAQSVEIPSILNNYQYWYFSKGDDFLITACLEEIPGTFTHTGTRNSSNYVECTTNNKIPTAITGGRFDGGVNFQLVP